MESGRGRARVPDEDAGQPGERTSDPVPFTHDALSFLRKALPQEVSDWGSQ